MYTYDAQHSTCQIANTLWVPFSPNLMLAEVSHYTIRSNFIHTTTVGGKGLLQCAYLNCCIAYLRCYWGVYSALNSVDPLISVSYVVEYIVKSLIYTFPPSPPNTCAHTHTLLVRVSRYHSSDAHEHRP